MSTKTSTVNAFGLERTAKLTVGMGIFVTLLMVFSGVSTVVTAHVPVGDAGAAQPTAAAPAASASSAPAASTTSSATHAPSASISSSVAALKSRTLAQLNADHVPSKYTFLPNFGGNGVKMTHGVLNGPASSAAPAPMGIGDYGVENTTGTATAYSYGTSSFKGTVTLNSLNPFYLENDGPTAVGFQLNTILYNVTVGDSTTNGTTVNHYWTQNVPFYDAASHSLFFVDNVWNFSNANMTVPSTTLIGTNGTLVAPVFYYAVWPATGITVAPPFTLTLYNNATNVGPSAPGTPSWETNPWGTVATMNSFGFTLTSANSISYTNASGTYKLHSLSRTYDRVYFFSDSTATSPSSLPTPQYKVSGTQCGLAIPVANGKTFCIPDDAEITTAIGPGGGSTTNVYGINSTMQLQSLSGTSYKNVRAAWDVGSETGETTQGVSEWWTTPGVVNIGPGPSIIYPMWNASGVTSTAGDIKVAATISPSNAWIFMTAGMVWAPSPMKGDTITYELPRTSGAGTTYSVTAELSNYAAASYTLTTASTTLAVTLTTNPALGVYTPLFAWNNAQLANISTAGTGTAGNPWQLAGAMAATGVNFEFYTYNDYGFPSFPGVLLYGTTQHVDANASGILDQGATALAFDTYNASYVSLYGSVVSGYFLPPMLGVLGFPMANVLLWNTTHSLIGLNTFLNSETADSIMVYNDPNTNAHNVIWNNTFVDYPIPGFAAAWPMGLELYSNGNLVYNNYFNTLLTARTPTTDLYTGASVVYADMWNVSYAPATTVREVNGYALTGSVMNSLTGYDTWIGGNYWNNCAVPYDNGGLISVGYDYLPYCASIPASTFTESGLSPIATWTVTVAATGQSFTSAFSGASLLLAPPSTAPGATTYNFTVTANGYPDDVPSCTGCQPVPGTNNEVYGYVTVTSTILKPSEKVFITPGAVSVTFTDHPGLNNVVTFVPSGIPYGSDGAPVAWSLSFGGVTLASATGGPISTTVPNGTYYFAISAVSTITPGGTAIYAPHPANGNITVSGSASNNYITFSALPEVATILNPTTGQVIPEGSAFAVSFSYDWMAATNATLTVSNASGFSKSYDVFESGGVGSGSYTFSLGPGNITVALSLVSANPGNPPSYVNTTVTASVAATTPQYTTIWENTTVYHNVSSSGFGVNALGAILIVVGIIVGFAIGYFVMMSSRPKTPNSPQAWDQPSSPSEPSKP